MSNFANELQKRLNPETSFEVPAGAPGQAGVLGRGRATQKDYQIDQGVFVLYRPIEACIRCRVVAMRALKCAEHGRDPPDEPVPETCTHVNKAAYLSVMQNCRNLGWVVLSWREETLKNGIVQASVTWGVPKETKTRSTPRTVPTL